MAGQKKEVVVDSSVVVKWFSDESETDKAVQLRDHHAKGMRQLWVADLLYYEVANALRYKSSYDNEKLGAAIKSLFMLHLNIGHVDENILQNAAGIAYDGDVTLYDAIPVALADARGTVCVTADEETQYKRLSGRGYPIVLLSKAIPFR